MRHSRWLLLFALVGGCGDDVPVVDGGIDQGVPSDFTVAADLTVPGAARFNGYWQLQSVTLVTGAPTDAGVPTLEVTRESSPYRLRGDYTFTASDGTHARLIGKLGMLEGDHLAQSAPLDADVTVDGDTWLIAPRPGTLVLFPGVLAGDTLTLTWDETDPRNVDAGDPPRHMVLRRMAAPPIATVGTWTMLELDVGGQTILGDTCIAVDGGSRIAHVVIEIDAVHLMTQTTTLTSYSDGACTVASGNRTVDVVKVLVDESVGGFEAWSAPHGEAAGDYTRWTLSTPAPKRVQIMRADCRPKPDCDSAPTRMLLERP